MACREIQMALIFAVELVEASVETYSSEKMEVKQLVVVFKDTLDWQGKESAKWAGRCMQNSYGLYHCLYCDSKN